MQTDILIIGGGLSGLIATWQLRYAGKNASVMEARTRFGGSNSNDEEATMVLIVISAQLGFGPANHLWPVY